MHYDFFSRFTRPHSRSLLSFVFLALSAALLSGCAGSESSIPDKLSIEKHASGNGQVGFHGTPLEKPLRVHLEGPQVPGLLGGKGSRSPIAGEPILFEVVNVESGAVFTNNGETQITVETATDGIAGAKLTLGDRSSDLLIRASVPSFNDISTVEFRVVSGVELIGKNLEGTTGSKLEEFGVRLIDPSGEPAQGVTVYFSAIDSSVGKSAVITDEEGRAVTSWKLGKHVKQYFAHVEIEDTRANIAPAQRFAVRTIEFKASALNKQKMLLTLFGGLGIFIFGMKLMSGGLQRVADRRLKSILQAMTRNTTLAVIVGAGLTAMVQSSSATTVMVVGFVNAGLVSLTQAIGIVYGANIGTTITAQMIAFKLDALAYPAIIVGLVASVISKRPAIKHSGEAMLGFGLLFLGMMTMSDILRPLRTSPEFIEWFQLFDCTPVNGMIPWRAAFMCVVIGTVVTVIVQSSSASIGLVLALCGQGLIPFYTAFPLILGDNIGTTITAILASLGANRNAKRTALAHMMFNVFGATYMYILLFVPLWNGEPLFLGFVNSITPGDVFAETPDNLPRHVANAHTAFNIMNCIIFIPLVGFMAKVCERIIPLSGEDRESKMDYLEPHLLKTPSLALELATKEVMYMVRRSQKSINDGCDFFRGGAASLADRILEREDIIDQLQAEITAYLVELSQQPLTPGESALIPVLIHAVNDAERIGDRSENLVELTQLRRQNKLPFTETAEKDIRALQELINKQFHAIYATLEGGDIDKLQEAKERDKEIGAIVERASEDHVKRLESGECQVQSGVIFLDFVSNLERVAAHTLNIEERGVKAVPQLFD